VRDDGQFGCGPISKKRKCRGGKPNSVSRPRGFEARIDRPPSNILSLSQHDDIHWKRISDLAV
jgi:hypothetical protein